MSPKSNATLQGCITGIRSCLFETNGQVFDMLMQSPKQIYAMRGLLRVLRI